MWVDSISFGMNGRNLRLSVWVVEENGALAGAQVGLDLSCSSGQNWTFNGITDSTGVATFTVSKAPPGDYVASVTSLAADGYVWDATQGITSASYTLNGNTTPGKPNKR